MYVESLRSDCSAGRLPQRDADAHLPVVVTSACERAMVLTGPPFAELVGDERNVLLTLARMILTLDTGRIVPKDEAVHHRGPGRTPPRRPRARRLCVPRRRDRRLDDPPSPREEHRGAPGVTYQAHRSPRLASRLRPRPPTPATVNPGARAPSSATPSAAISVPWMSSPWVVWRADRGPGREEPRRCGTPGADVHEVTPPRAQRSPRRGPGARSRGRVGEAEGSCASWRRVRRTPASPCPGPYRKT